MVVCWKQFSRKLKLLSSVELFTLKPTQGFLSVGNFIVWISVNWFVMAIFWLTPVWLWFFAASNFWRRNFSLVTRYSLKFTRCSSLVVKSLVTRSKIRSLVVAKNHSLLVAEVARCKNHSLLVAKFSRYSLQKLLVAKNQSLLVAEVARCKKSLVTRCKIRSLLVAEVARCKKSLVTRCKICSLLAAKIHSSLVMKKTQELMFS